MTWVVVQPCVIFNKLYIGIIPEDDKSHHKGFICIAGYNESDITVKKENSERWKCG